jgi:hypothetical protein
MSDRHVGDNFLERFFLARMRLVLLAEKLESKLFDLSASEKFSITRHCVSRGRRDTELREPDLQGFTQGRSPSQTQEINSASFSHAM